MGLFGGYLVHLWPGAIVPMLAWSIIAFALLPGIALAEWLFLWPAGKRRGAVIVDTIFVAAFAAFAIIVLITSWHDLTAPSRSRQDITAAQAAVVAPPQCPRGDAAAMTGPEDTSDVSR